MMLPWQNVKKLEAYTQQAEKKHKRIRKEIQKNLLNIKIILKR